MSKCRDLGADARGSNRVDPDVHRAGLFHESALFELMTHGGGKRRVESCEEAVRLRCRNAGGNAGAIR